MRAGRRASAAAPRFCAAPGKARAGDVFHAGVAAQLGRDLAGRVAADQGGDLATPGAQGRAAGATGLGTDRRAGAARLIDQALEVLVAAAVGGLGFLPGLGLLPRLGLGLGCLLRFLGLALVGRLALIGELARLRLGLLPGLLLALGALPFGSVA